jgi:hypothetical protein
MSGKRTLPTGVGVLGVASSRTGTSPCACRSNSYVATAGSPSLPTFEIEVGEVPFGTTPR